MPVELYFVYAPGCGACESTKPVVETFARKYGRNVDVIWADISNTEWPPIGTNKWTPDKTPTFILRIGDQAWALEGGLDLEELEGWVQDKFRKATGAR